MTLFDPPLHDRLLSSSQAKLRPSKPEHQQQAPKAARMSDGSTSNPGLVTGHAKLAAGKVQEALGYTQEGQSNVQAGTDELKAYSQQNPPSDQGGSTLGKVESSIGSAVGCEGLEQGGQKKQNAE